MYILILYSSIVSILLFGIMFYFENKNREDTGEDYNIYNELFTPKNIIVFCIINLIVFAIIYMAFSEKTDILSMVGLSGHDYGKMNNITKSNIVDPTILRNSSEPMKAGFEPYNSSGEISEGSYDSSSSESVK